MLELKEITAGVLNRQRALTLEEKKEALAQIKKDKNWAVIFDIPGNDELISTIITRCPGATVTFFWANIFEGLSLETHEGTLLLPTGYALFYRWEH